MDINAVEKRLAQLQTSTTRTTNLWKPQPGKTQIRILPYKLNSDTPFIELFFHYDLGGKSYLSQHHLVVQTRLKNLQIN